MWHTGLVCSNLLADWGLFIRCLHALFVPAWLSFVPAGFLPQFKITQIRSTGYTEVPLICMCVWLVVWLVELALQYCWLVTCPGCAPPLTQTQPRLDKLLRPMTLTNQNILCFNWWGRENRLRLLQPWSQISAPLCMFPNKQWDAISPASPRSPLVS